MTDVLPRLEIALQGRYVIERELGHGGMATVYLAEDLRLHRRVALKVLHPDLAATLGADRFQREIAIAARLTHPHILPLYDSGTAEGRLFYAMPYVEGESLRARLRREPQLPVAETVALLTAVAGALDYAHRQGVVHRDIKPENILLATDPGGGPAHPLVADFGIARALDVAGGERLTETGLVLGTPAYMSPEQATAGGHLDGRSDLYALGCVAYEMLAGAPPFTGPTAQAILSRHAVDPVPALRTVRPGVPEPVEQAIVRALAKVPADRFATASEFATALTHKGQALLPRLRPSRFRSVRGLGAIGVGAVAVVGALAGYRAVRERSGPTVVPSAARIAIFPLAAPEPDTALIRLGRDLATTVSASLDGVGEIETVDRLDLVQRMAGQQLTAPADMAALARRLGAASLFRGTIVRNGADVRLDVGLYDAKDSRPLIKGISIAGQPDSLGALTDSVVWALLRHVWQRGEPPSPSLAAATTHSLSALRSFLEGERYMEQAWWASAALAYRSAIASDSTFWLAYFRYIQARRWAGEEDEPKALSALLLHRSVLPDRDRLLVEAMAEPSLIKEAALLQEEVGRFPDYWPGWFQWADLLYHVGPMIGYSWRDAQNAFGRVVALNPRLKPAWHHLFWNSLGKDSLESTNAFSRYRALPGNDPLANQAQGAFDLQQMRLVQALDSAGGVIAPHDSALADSVAEFSVSPAASELERAPSFLWAGNPAGQVEFSRRALRLTSDPLAAADQYTWMAVAWAERGAWDSALVAAQEAAARRPHMYPLAEYNLAVLGTFLNVVPAAVAIERRHAATARIQGTADPRQKAELFGRLAWLDGMLAFAQADQGALARARADARVSGHPNAEVIDRSLAAFADALDGHRVAAAKELVALDQHCAMSYWEQCGNTTFPNVAVQRLAAATWLLEAGDTMAAARLLTFKEARFFPNLSFLIVTPLAYLMEARIEEARGDTAVAGEHYRQFLRRYDRPMPGQRHLAIEAQTALARLSGHNDPAPSR